MMICTHEASTDGALSLSFLHTMARGFTFRDAAASTPTETFDVDALVEMFASTLDPDLIRDVARGSVDASSALDALLSLSQQQQSNSFETSTSTHRRPMETQYFGGNLPDDVRDVIFSRLSAKDAAVLACTCREFNALVESWRSRATNLDLPKPSASGKWSDAERVASMLRAYPNAKRISFKKLGRALKPSAEEDADDWLKLKRVLAAAARGNDSSKSVEAIDFEGVAEWLTEFSVVEIGEFCRESFPSLTSLSLPRARALTGKGLSRLLQSCGETLRELKLVGCVSLDDDSIRLLLDSARGLRSIDLTGCSGIKQLKVEAQDAPNLERFKAVNCASMTTCSIRRTAASNALKSINLADCSSLRSLQVQSGSVELVNAAGCKSMDILNIFAPRCETLLLNKCASLRGLTEEINTCRTNLSSLAFLTLDSCKVFTSSGFADLLNMCAGTLIELSAEGCFSIERVSCASTKLERCAVSGCVALQVVRLSSANCKRFVARACKTLTEVRFENGSSYNMELFDVRNSAALKRVVGVKRARVRRIDASGCPSDLDFIESAFA